MVGRGHGHGREHEHGPDKGRQDGPLDQRLDPPDPDGPDQGASGRGRSEQSPGHLKKAGGAQDARDFAPGRRRRG